MRFSGFITRLTGALTVLNFCIGSTAAALPSGVIFPLYIDPGENCAGWTPLLNAIRDHPNLEFIVVINPASGPGPVGSQPDTNYQVCVPRLRNSQNVKVLGYVATGRGVARSFKNVTDTIDIYAQWNAPYRPTGIFFDEAASGAEFVPLYQSYAIRARQALKLPAAYVTLNPGVVPSPGYFNKDFDLIVTFENYYAEFAKTTFPTGLLTPTSKQAAIIHTAPTSPEAVLQTVKKITKTGLGASFYSNFTNDIAYAKFPPPTVWNNYLDDLVSTQ